MAITPLFARVPQYVFTVVSTAILIPLAIIGAKHFYTVLVNILSVIGWSTIFAAIILTEHFLFCKNNFNSYQIQDWDKPSTLPIGIAALFFPEKYMLFPFYFFPLLALFKEPAQQPSRSPSIITDAIPIAPSLPTTTPPLSPSISNSSPYSSNSSLITCTMTTAQSTILETASVKFHEGHKAAPILLAGPVTPAILNQF
ncbi:hypothetical protein BYT27DRAFT_7213743 [Phlegmacium glaucopus]|nr:hypothetical protein BYT27DRAFT_7213743 [Phlegmacium glaucopus]